MIILIIVNKIDNWIFNRQQKYKKSNTKKRINQKFQSKIIKFNDFSLKKKSQFILWYHNFYIFADPNTNGSVVQFG